MLHYTWTDYISVLISAKKSFQHHKFNTLLNSITLDKYLVYTYTFENELFPTTMVQRRKHVFVAGYNILFSGLMSMFTFDTLQIPSRCIHICSGCIARTYIPLATGLAEGMAFVWQDERFLFLMRVIGFKTHYTGNDDDIQKVFLFIERVSVITVNLLREWCIRFNWFYLISASTLI